MKTTNLTILMALLCLGGFSAQAQQPELLPELNFDGYSLQMPDMNCDMDNMLAQRGGRGSSSGGSNGGGQSNGGFGSSNINNSTPGTSYAPTTGSSSNSNNSNNRAGNYGSYYNENYYGYPSGAAKSDNSVTVDTTTVYVIPERVADHGAPKHMLIVYAGMNMSKPDAYRASNDIDFKSKNGFDIGMRWDIMAPHLGICYWSFGADFSKKNFRAEYPGDLYCKYDANIIQIPIYYGLRGNLGSNCFIGGGVGPVIDLGLGGECTKNTIKDLTVIDPTDLSSTTTTVYGKETIDTYSGNGRGKFTCGLGAEFWVNFKRIFFGYSFDMNLGKDPLCEQEDINYTHKKGYLSHSIKIGYTVFK